MCVSGGYVGKYVGSSALIVTDYKRVLEIDPSQDAAGKAIMVSCLAFCG